VAILAAKVRRGFVPPLLGQPGVFGDVEEAHRRRTVQPAEQAGPFQGALHHLDGALAPGVLLLPAVDGEEGLLGERR